MAAWSRPAVQEVEDLDQEFSIVADEMYRIEWVLADGLAVIRGRHQSDRW